MFIPNIVSDDLRNKEMGLMNAKEKLDKVEEYCKMVIDGWNKGNDYDYYEWKFAKIILDIINENRNGS